ncbi:MAG TPA: MCE family protein [Deltaproteobacteria bacterium]|nr:MCE family protein [Deltaproteobacteria bacterium]
MALKANYFKIGVFVIVAAIITVIGVIVLGAGTIFRKKVMIETYFQESVQGLEIGSPLKFRGVRFGRVEDITLLGKEYLTQQRYILVRVSMPSEDFVLKAGKMTPKEFENEIEKGLRIRMAFQGITGTAFLEMDYLDPSLNPPLKLDWTPKYFYIPSSQSTISRISTSLDRLMKNLEKIKMNELVEGLEMSARTVKAALAKADIASVSKEVKALLVETRATNRTLNQIIDGAEMKGILAKTSAALTGIQRGSEQIPGVLEQTKKILGRLDGLINKKQQDIEVSIDNLRVFSENLREITENAKKNPSQFFFGKPPPPVKLPKK